MKLCNWFIIAVVFEIVSMSAAHAEDKDVDNIINNPNVDSWQIYGPQSNRKIKDPLVQGGKAIEVKVTGDSTQPYSTAGQSPIHGAIHKGDHLVGAVWLKTVQTASGAPGQAGLRLQLSTDPYTGIGQQQVSLTGEWKLYNVDAVAQQDFSRDSTNLSVQLGFGQQTIDLGPAFVLDLGPEVQ